MALTKIGTDGVKDDAITSGKIPANAVGTSEIANDAVGADQLSNTSVSAGAFGSSSAIPALTVDAQGRITAATTNSISIPPAFDDNKIINDISTLSLKLNALQNATRYNTNSTYVDTFQDANGIATQTNTSRNSVGEYISSIAAVTKYYYKPNVDKWTWTQSSTGVGGNSAMTFVGVIKSANGSNWTYNGSQGGGIFNLETTNNSSPYVLFGIGNASNNGQFGTHTPGRSDCNASMSAPTDKWVWAVVRTYSNWLASNVDIMYRAIDESSWTTLSDSNGGSDNAGVLGSGQGRLFRHDSSNYTGDYDNTHVAHLGFWNTRLNDTQLNGLFNNGKFFDWSTNSADGDYTLSSNLQEYFALDEGSGTTFANDGNGGTATKQSGSGAWDSDTTTFTTVSATGNFISNVITASASTTKMGVVITYIDSSGTATLNTDLKVYLSADNGSNFTQVTLVAQPDFSTGVKMALANDVTVTAGTQLKYKVEFANQALGSKETRVTGISLQY